MEREGREDGGFRGVGLKREGGGGVRGRRGGRGERGFRGE